MAKLTMEDCIVIQGPHYGDNTRIVIRQFLIKNPNVQIILSTYKESESLLNPWEKYLQDRGKVIYIFTEPPPRSEDCFWRTNFANQNLQRLTSYIGLKRADDLGFKYSLKVRSDTFLGKDRVINYFKDLLETYPLSSSLPGLRGRIIVGSHATISHSEREIYYPPFHVRDHWYFGYTQDILKFFDMDSPTWNRGCGIDVCSPESSLTRVWMADLKIDDCHALKDLLGRYFIVENFHVVEQCRIHVVAVDQQQWIIDMKEYLKHGSKYLQAFLSSLEDDRMSTTRETWEEMRIEACKE